MSITPQTAGGKTLICLRGTTTPIGTVRGQWFEKTIQGSKHFLRAPTSAIAFDLATLEDAERAGAVHVAITDSDTRHVYRQRIETIRRYGFSVVRGFGRQIALPLTGYAIDGRAPELPPGEPVTNKERQEAQLSLFAGGA